MRMIASCLFAVFLAFPAFAGPPAENDGMQLAQLITGTPQQKLQKLLRPHAFYGDRVSDDIRAATGDPSIAVIDRRWEWGEIYSCNYIYLKGRRQGRALVCE